MIRTPRYHWKRSVQKISQHAMKPKRGRPFDRSNEPALRRLETWLAVETQRQSHKGQPKLSIREAIRRLAEAGGVNFLIGGDRIALAPLAQGEAAGAKANLNRRNIIRRELKVFSKHRVGFVDDQEGTVFAREVVREAATLRTRYYEAVNLLKQDDDLKAFYHSILETRLSS